MKSSMLWPIATFLLAWISLLSPTSSAEPIATIPDLSLQRATVCASLDGGFWVIGANAALLVAVKYSANSRQPSTYSTGINNINSHFNKGKCTALSDTSIYFVSDSHTGIITIDPSNNARGTWAQLNGNVGSIIIGNLQQDQYAVINNTPNPILVAIVNNNILRGTIGTSSSSGTASLKEYVIVNVIGMSISKSQSAPGVLYLWIYHANTDMTQQRLTRLDIANKSDSVTFNLPVDTSRRQLVPLSDDSGVAILASDGKSTLASYYTEAGQGLANISVPVDPNRLQDDLFFISQSTLFQVNPTGMIIDSFPSGQPLPTDPGLTAPPSRDGATPPPADAPKPANPGSKNNLGIIIGSVVGALALLAAIGAFIVIRKRKGRGGRTSTRKRKDLFPAKADESMVPLGLYHQNRSLPEVPKHLEDNLQRLGHNQGHNGSAHANIMAAGVAPFMSPHSRNSSNNTLDENIPIEAALKHHRHDMNTPQGLKHSVSVSSTTSNFARRNVKSGKRFEEKIQLQVIRYEIQDAHLISPHGPTGRLVLGTYHVISPPRSARSVKSQGGASRVLARSGTVVVRKSRTDFKTSQLPSREMAQDSSMLLTDAENQHTFEASTLKWYMTEIHWKREAALLKHLKSPIFVMELMESYCIPALQNRANTYPFVNAMGGCSRLLSDVGPIKTAQHARAILRSISAAVDWCHRHGVVHLNIQPGSFFLEDGVDPKTEDAPWKLWDFTCARFIGEPIGTVGGGGPESSHLEASFTPSPHPPPNHLHPEAYPYLEQRQMEEQLDRIGGNPLPAAYTAPELLEAWRAGDTTFPAEAVMDSWSLGCVYYEILSGQPLFPTEADAWRLIGGWDNKTQWTTSSFRVPYPPTVTESPAAVNVLPGASTPAQSVQDNSTPYEKSRILDPSGSISQLIHSMMAVHADERILLETIMERIY
ncbi:Chromosomal serine/threonine-protein kinase jil-1 [Mortierella sp. AM989]|nr:Chromosomal serine/threonine-protein kinase jil-1 [Mortierella sp. AM989]